MKFQLHNLETSSSDSKPLLEDSIKAFGRIPNLHAVMAESPIALKAYKQLHEWFQETGFNADELTVIWQTINVEHQCHYCIPAHTGIAHMMNIDQGIIDALVNRQPLTNEKLQTLHKTTLLLVQNRGHLSDEERESFYNAGYENKHLLGILVGIAQKVMSNYTNHLADTPVDSMFEQFV